jgi:hypothetical protein
MYRVTLMVTKLLIPIHLMNTEPRTYEHFNKLTLTNLTIYLVCMYVYSNGGPQMSLAPRPSLIYCASPINNTSYKNVNIQKFNLQTHFKEYIMFVSWCSSFSFPDFLVNEVHL